MKDRIGTVSALIAVAGVAIYLLGIAAIVIPLRRDVFSDWTTAFFAASLLPNTWVAWRGVTSFLIPWVGALAWFLVVAFLSSIYSLVVRGVNAYLNRRINMALDEAEPDEADPRYLRTVRFANQIKRIQNWVAAAFTVTNVTLGVLVGGGLTILFAILAAESGGLLIPPYHSAELYYFAGSLVIVAGALMLAAIFCVYRERSATTIAALVLGTSILVAFPYALLAPLEGPSIEIGKRDTEAGVAAAGLLLANDSAGWYVLDVSPTRAPYAPKLLAIPNAQAQKVCVWEKAPATQLVDNKLDC